MIKRTASAISALTLFCIASVAPALAGDCQPEWNHGMAGSGPVFEIAGSAGVTDSIIFDDGTGAALYVGGDFPTFNGVPGTQGIAKWDGTSWSSVGGGVASFGRVQALEVYDDGTGPALYVGGIFLDAGGVPNTENIAKWDGVAWSPAQSGPSPMGTVHDLEVANLDVAEGPRLYAGGSFNFGSTLVMKLNPSEGNWSSVGAGTGTVYKLQEYIDNGTPYLWAGGTIQNLNGAASNLSRYNGTSWNGAGVGTDQFGTVWELHVHDDGTGPALYVGGEFETISGVDAPRLAKRVGNTWQALGGGIGETRPCPTCIVAVFALGTFDDGTGPALYAGGNFIEVDGEPVDRLAKWDGTDWSPVGTGAIYEPSEVRTYIRDMTTFNGCGGLAPGTPEVLFIAGKFTTMDGVGNNSVAQLSACTGGVLGDLNGNGTVDLPDLNLVLANFGQDGSEGDINGDCTVNLTDLNLLLANFGNFEG